MSLQAMTIEKLKFSLPAVFTIGPADTLEALEKYAVLLTGESDGRPVKTMGGNAAVSAGHVQDIVKGIIEGETRSIVSTMTMEELFRERKMFKDKIIQHVQSELDQFGLCIYNANVKELQDTPGSEYFAVLSRKAHEGALNQAKVDVADARMKGEVGEAEKQGKTKQAVAKIHAETAVLETERKSEKAIADAKLTDKEIQIGKELNIARINAKREAERRDAELSTEVEKKKALMELERLRATTVTQAKIAKESSQERADADLYTQEKAAEGKKFSEQADADAAAYRLTKDAEAQFLAKEEGRGRVFPQRTRGTSHTHNAATRSRRSVRHGKGLRRPCQCPRRPTGSYAVPHAAEQHVRASCERQRAGNQGHAAQDQRVEYRSGRRRRRRWRGLDGSYSQSLPESAPAAEHDSGSDGY
jgi:flotillin